MKSVYLLMREYWFDNGGQHDAHNLEVVIAYVGKPDAHVIRPMLPDETLEVCTALAQGKEVTIRGWDYYVERCPTIEMLNVEDEE